MSLPNTQMGLPATAPAALAASPECLGPMADTSPVAKVGPCNAPNAPRRRGERRTRIHLSPSFAAAEDAAKRATSPQPVAVAVKKRVSVSPVITDMEVRPTKRVRSRSSRNRHQYVNAGTIYDFAKRYEDELKHSLEVLRANTCAICMEPKIDLVHYSSQCQTHLVISSLVNLDYYKCSIAFRSA
jgi:hypothetical protein